MESGPFPKIYILTISNIITPIWQMWPLTQVFCLYFICWLWLEQYFHLQSVPSGEPVIYLGFLCLAPESILFSKVKVNETAALVTWLDTRRAAVGSHVSLSACMLQLHTQKHKDVVKKQSCTHLAPIDIKCIILTNMQIFPFEVVRKLLA